MTLRVTFSIVALAAALGPMVVAGQRAATTASAVWFDPAWTTARGNTAAPRAVIWFDGQLLWPGDRFEVRASQLKDEPRSALRRRMVDSLKRLSDASWRAARGRIEALERDGVVRGCVRSWIVNAVTCELPGGDPAPLAGIPGARRVFRATPSPAQGGAGEPEVVPAPAAERFTPDPARADWNARMLGVDRVWSEYGLTGRGVLQVVHDFGWTFRPAAIRATLWRNTREQPGDGIDNDRNGRIDDVHGFNFDTGNADLGPPGGAPLPGGLTHGDLTAAMLAGRQLADTAVILGMAPDSRWAAVISTASIEPAVEWAIEQGADTYSMSFSVPNLGEMRTHFRKVMEHAALAGIFFVSGAGNFADSTRPNFAPVPVQMRIPEDIPFAVLGVAGVGRDGTRPSFSSQGPVEWRTSEYDEGTVPKPDLATINTNLLGLDSLGNGHVPSPRGWSGNSFAGPHLAGVLALMLEADPELTPWSAREILMQTARDIGTPGVDSQSGAGLVDAFAAVTEVRRRAERRDGVGSGR